MGSVALQIMANRPDPALFDLPWSIPLEDWDASYLAALPRDVRGDLQQGQCAAHVAIGSRGDFAQRVGGYP